MIVSRNEENAIVDTPSAAKMAKTTEAWIDSSNVFTPEGEGNAHPSTPTPCVMITSGSGAAFLLKNDKDDDDDDDDDDEGDRGADLLTIMDLESTLNEEA